MTQKYDNSFVSHTYKESVITSLIDKAIELSEPESDLRISKKTHNND